MPEAAQRIVSLAPHATELLFAVGAEVQIVGVMAGSDYPEKAKTLPTVGDYQSVSLETLVRLQPDLVVSWPSGNPIGLPEQLARFDIPLFASDPVSVTDIAQDLSALGKLTGNESQGDAQAKILLSGIDDMADTYAKRQPIRTLLMISDLPMMGLSNTHAVAEAFETCGAINVLANMQAKAPMIGREGLMLLQPELIIITHEVADKKQWLQQRGYTGLQKPELASIDPDLILRQTPRMRSGIQHFCETVDALR